MSIYQTCSNLVATCSDPKNAKCVVTSSSIKLYCNSQDYSTPTSTTSHNSSSLPCNQACSSQNATFEGCQLKPYGNNQMEISSVCQTDGYYYATGKSTIYIN